MIKRLLLGLIALVVVIGVVGALLIKNLDLNLHKDKIQQVVLDKTGRELQINGEISASIFPWVGLSLNDVTLANAANFSDSVFARVNSSDVKVELLPLIGGNLNVNLVELHGLELNLQKDADGRSNWEDLMSTTGVVETSGGDDVVHEVEAGAPIVAALSVGGLVVTDAKVTWQDLNEGSDVALDEFNLSTGVIQISKPFHFDTDFKVASDSIGIASEVVASGEINLNLNDNVYALSELELTTTAAGSALPLERLQATIGGDLITDLNAQTFDLTSFSGNIAGLPLTGEIHGTSLMDAPSLFGDLKSGVFDAAEILDQIGVELPEDFNRALLSESGFSVRFQQSEDQLLLNDVLASTGGVELNGDFQITNLAQSPVVSGTLSSNSFSPLAWAQTFGVQASDPLVLQNAQFTTAIRQSGQLLALNDLNFTLDDFTLQGNVEINDINATIPPIKFALQGSRINIDRYLPMAEITEGEAAPVPPADTSAAALIPVDLIRQLDIEGELTLEQLTASGITVENIVLPVIGRDGRLEVKEARAGLYSGTLFSTLSLDATAQEPLLTISTNVNGVQAEPLLADYLKSDAPLSGTGIISIDLLSRGETLDGLLSRASGAITTRFTDGALNGVNIGREVRRAQAVLTGQQLSAVEPEVKTDFTELSISAEIADGVLHSEDLSFKSPLMRLSGAGGVNMTEQTIDYLLQVLISTTTEGQGGKELSELNGLQLPVPIRGSFTDLSVDFTGMLVDGLKSDLLNQLRSRKDAMLNQQKEAVAAKLKQEEAAVKARVEKERAAAQQKLQEKRQAAVQKAEEKQQQQLQQQLEQEKEQLKNKLEKNLKKGLSNLLGE